MKLDVVVLAGSANVGALKECSQADNEALINIGKKYMVEYVVEALMATEIVNRIIIAGPEKELKDIFGSKAIVVQGGNTIITTLTQGLKEIHTSNPVLVVSSDIPLLTPAAIKDFVQRCTKKEAEFYYPIIPIEAVEKRFPSIKRTYVNLLEGVFTGGNILLIQPHVVEKCTAIAEDVVKLRKKPIKLCQLLGLKVLFKYILGKLSIVEIESKIEELLNVKGAAVVSNYPEIGVDVDKPSDLELVLTRLSKTA